MIFKGLTLTDNWGINSLREQKNTPTKNQYISDKCDSSPPNPQTMNPSTTVMQGME